MKKNHTAFIGLGSNLEDPLSQCHQALKFIKEMPQTEILSCSSFFKTEPLVPQGEDKTSVPWYINAVCKLSTTLSAQELLDHLQRIEKKMGRIRGEKWASRVIDLDLLFYEDTILDSQHLTLPHPELEKRPFVLVPINEIAPNWQHPRCGKTVSVLLSELGATTGVYKI